MIELIAINVVVGDRTYRLRVDPKDEERVRKTAALINEKMSAFRVQFAGKDMQDYLSMVLLWFATELGGNTDPSVVNAIEGKLTSIQELLSNLDK